MKDLYTRKYKTLLKEAEEDTKKCKDILYSWIGRINIVKMAILPKAIHRFNRIPLKIPMLKKKKKKKIEQNIIRFVWNHKKPEGPKQS